MVNWLKHYGKRICSFVCVICAVICSQGNFFWGNLPTCFSQSNYKWEYAFNKNIFISNFMFYYFLHKAIFSLEATYGIPSLQIRARIY